jgi:hydroxyacylglutathione hydrolase
MRRRFSSQFLGMNSALVYNDIAAYLIDPGVFPPELDRIKEFIRQQSLEHISILLTHTHGDHISGWHAFRKYPVFTHQCVSSKVVAARENEVKFLKGIYRKQDYQVPDEVIFPDRISYMEDGEFKEISPDAFAFFHVPGHSTDMSAIVVQGERILFSGDMLIQAPTPFILHSIRQYWHSLKRLEEIVIHFEIDCLIPGHGKPAKSGERILQRIQNEMDYIQELVVTGIEISHSADSETEIKSKLYEHFHRFQNLHSHQVNVQTFIREYDNIYMDDFIIEAER